MSPGPNIPAGVADGLTTSLYINTRLSVCLSVCLFVCLFIGHEKDGTEAAKYLILAIRSTARFTGSYEFSRDF